MIVKCVAVVTINDRCYVNLKLVRKKIFREVSVSQKEGKKVDVRIGVSGSAAESRIQRILKKGIVCEFV